MKNLTSTNKVIICAGSGGVGKTTVSAALGCMAASQGKKVLVLTIDPAKRLKTILGLEDQNEVVRVPNQNFAGELYAGVIDSKKVFEQFIRTSASSVETAERILKNTLYKQLSTTLSGSEEFTSIVQLYNSTHEGQYDLVILDTPPAQHAIDFLEAPDRIYALFQSSVTQWFSEQAQKSGLITKFINRGTNLALTALEKVTGDGFIHELFDFFTSLKSIQGHISERCKKTQELLKDAQTAFVLVTSFDQAKHYEAKEFASQLVEGKYRLQSLVVNRAYPEWFLQQKKNSVNWVSQVEEPLRPLAVQMSHYFLEREKMYNQLAVSMDENIKTIFIPESITPLTGLSALTEFSNFISSK